MASGLREMREKQEERARLLAEFPEQNPIPIIECDLAGELIWQNPASKEHLIVDGENAVLRGLRAEWNPLLEELRRDPRRPVKRIVSRGSRAFEAHIHIVPERSRIRVWAPEITERLRDEELSRRFDLMANSVSEFLTLINRDLVYEAANDAYCRAHRMRREALVGKKVSQIWGEKVMQTVLKGHLERCFEGQVISYQLWIEFPGLGRRYFDVSYYPRRDESGTVTHAVVLSRDITHVLEMEDRLRHAEKRDALARVAQGLVDELERPIKTLAERTRGAGENPSLERIKNLLDGMRTFFEPRRESKAGADVNALVLAILEKAAENNSADIRIAKELKQIPPAPIDAASLSQVLGQLVSNAFQSFDAAAPGEKRISVETWQDDAGIHIAIADTGRGIPPHEQERIFDPFATGGRKRSGLGLGLTVSRNILAANGGTIEIHSHGRGTQVVVSLPLTQARATSRTADRSNAPIVVPKRRGHLVVVDDERPVAASLQAALGDEHDVLIFTSAKEVLAFFDKKPAVDIVFCDLMMPEMSGMDIFASIEPAQPDLTRRFVFMSGGITSPQAERFLQTVPNRRCAKPIGAAAIRRLTAEFLTELNAAEDA